MKSAVRGSPLDEYKYIQHEATTSSRKNKIRETLSSPGQPNNELTKGATTNNITSNVDLYELIIKTWKQDACGLVEGILHSFAKRREQPPHVSL
jgi:hypothetical protein